MGSMKVVIDISSDSESSPPCKATRSRKRQWKNWREGDGYESEVSIVKKTSSKKRTGKKRRKNKDFDDDCIILDSDPEKGAVEFSVKSPGKKDLVVVGERGQVACRDYPHSRHLCAKFPFKSTQYRKHCLMCYCYVCDARAPCLKWESHCEASDKEDKWRAMRNIFKTTRNIKGR